MYIIHHAMYSFDLQLIMRKALDQAEMSGNFVTIDICHSISLANEVLNLQSKSLYNHPLPMAMGTILALCAIQHAVLSSANP